MNKVDKKMYQTNKGFVKGGDLKGEYYVVIIQDLTLLDNIKSDKTFIGVHNVDEYVSLQWYNLYHESKLDIQNDNRGNTFETVTRCSIDFKSHNSYDYNMGNDIARIYWMEQLLPQVYADIFTNAMMYNTRDNNKIEESARQLNEALKQ